MIALIETKPTSTNFEVKYFEFEFESLDLEILLFVQTLRSKQQKY